MKTFFVLLSLFIASHAEAFIVAKLGNTPFEKRRPTHVIVAGEGNEAEKLFQQAAITKGLKYQDMYPQDQIVFIFQHQGVVFENEMWLESRGIKVLKSGPLDLDIKTFVKYADDVRVIATLDIFSHSAISYGSKLSETSRLRAADKLMLSIRTNFTPEAYIVVHGCNSGFEEALRYSDVFGVPAFGSLTSTDFQEKLADGKWYYNNPEDQPAGIPLDPACENGLCIRLKPVNAVYAGHWGSYTGGGLPFYKLFCLNIMPQKCLAALARYAMTYVSSFKLSRYSGLEEYKAVVQDILCPINPNKPVREDCVAKLNALPLDSAIPNDLMTYSPFRGKQLQCSMLGCEFRFECSDPTVNSGHCDLINTATETPTTFVDEYLNYMNAFRYMKYL